MKRFFSILVLAMTLTANLSSAADTVKFECTLFIGKPAAMVWDALVKKELVDRYYLAPLSEMELKPGGKMGYGKSGAELISGEVKEVVAPTKLVHTFHFSGSNDPETLVTYEIKPCGMQMCSLHLVHSGFAKENQTYADISGGWPVILSSLKTVLETGKTLPWPKQ